MKVPRVDEGDLAVPGAAIGVLRGGTATTAYYGVKDVTTGEPVTSETRFSVGSLTKSMVATVIARLGESGRLSLDDPVAAHVPELRGSEWAERATLQDLLANRSGLPLRAELEFGFDSRTDTDDSALSRLAADVDVTTSMAGFWSYTNVGWCLLGRVIETVADTAWEEPPVRQGGWFCMRRLSRMTPQRRVASRGTR